MRIPAIETIGGKRRNFEKGRARIKQKIDAITDKELAARLMPLPRLGAAAFRRRREFRLQFSQLRPHRF